MLHVISSHVMASRFKAAASPCPALVGQGLCRFCARVLSVRTELQLPATSKDSNPVILQTLTTCRCVLVPHTSGGSNSLSCSSRCPLTYQGKRGNFEKSGGLFSR